MSSANIPGQGATLAKQTTLHGQGQRAVLHGRTHNLQQYHRQNLSTPRAFVCGTVSLVYCTPRCPSALSKRESIAESSTTTCRSAFSMLNKKSSTAVRWLAANVSKTKDAKSVTLVLFHRPITTATFDPSIVKGGDFTMSYIGPTRARMKLNSNSAKVAYLDSE